MYYGVKHRLYRYVNATKWYLHFGNFAGDAILCSNFFCFSIVFTCLVSFIKIELGLLRLFRLELNLVLCVFTCKFFKSRELNSISPKCQIRPYCIHMTKCPLELSRGGGEKNKEKTEEETEKAGENII